MIKIEAEREINKCSNSWIDTWIWKIFKFLLSFFRYSWCLNIKAIGQSKTTQKKYKIFKEKTMKLVMKNGLQIFFVSIFRVKIACQFWLTSRVRDDGNDQLMVAHFNGMLYGRFFHHPHSPNLVEWKKHFYRAQKLCVYVCVCDVKQRIGFFFRFILLFFFFSACVRVCPVCVWFIFPYLVPF